jgi:hypothetical protein
MLRVSTSSSQTAWGPIQKPWLAVCGIKSGAGIMMARAGSGVSTKTAKTRVGGGRLQYSCEARRWQPDRNQAPRCVGRESRTDDLKALAGEAAPVSRKDSGFE